MFLSVKRGKKNSIKKANKLTNIPVFDSVKSPNTASNGSAHMVYKWARTSSCRLIILTIPELVWKMFGIFSQRRASLLTASPANWFWEAERVFIAAPVSSNFIRLTVRSKFTRFSFFFFVLGERRMDRFEGGLERLRVDSPSLPISELRRGPAAGERTLTVEMGLGIVVESTAGDKDLTDPNFLRAFIAMLTGSN